MDLVNKQMKIWSKNFEMAILTKYNPNSAYSFQNPHSAPKVNAQVSMKSFDIEAIHQTRRSLIDPKFLIISIASMSNDGRLNYQYLQFIFSSVFKLF